MDVYFKGKSYRPTEDEAKGPQEGKRNKLQWFASS